MGHRLQDGEKVQTLYIFFLKLWLSIQPIDCFNLDFLFIWVIWVC